MPSLHLFPLWWGKHLQTKRVSSKFLSCTRLQNHHFKHHTTIVIRWPSQKLMWDFVTRWIWGVGHNGWATCILSPSCSWFCIINHSVPAALAFVILRGLWALIFWSIVSRCRPGSSFEGRLRMPWTLSDGALPLLNVYKLFLASPTINPASASNVRLLCCWTFRQSLLLERQHGWRLDVCHRVDGSLCRRLNSVMILVIVSTVASRVVLVVTANNTSSVSLVCETYRILGEGDGLSGFWRHRERRGEQTKTTYTSSSGTSFVSTNPVCEASFESTKEIK